MRDASTGVDLKIDLTTSDLFRYENETTGMLKLLDISKTGSYAIYPKACNNYICYNTTEYLDPLIVFKIKPKEILPPQPPIFVKPLPQEVILSMANMSESGIATYTLPQVSSLNLSVSADQIDIKLEGVDSSWILFDRATLTFSVKMMKFENITQAVALETKITLADKLGEASPEILTFVIEPFSEKENEDESS